MTTGFLYLAGPMTDRPAFNFPAFAAARADLRARGLNVYCPAEADTIIGFDPETGAGLRPRSWYMSRDLPMVRASAGVVVLPGWTESIGARREVAEARRAGLPVLEYPHLTAIPDPAAPLANRTTNANTIDRAAPWGAGGYRPVGWPGGMVIL